MFKVLLNLYFVFQCFNCLISIILLLFPLIISVLDRNSIALFYIIYIILMFGSLISTYKIIRMKMLNSFFVACLMLFPVCACISYYFLYSVYEQLHKYGL